MIQDVYSPIPDFSVSSYLGNIASTWTMARRSARLGGKERIESNEMRLALAEQR